MPSNVELKARLSDPDAAHAVARGLTGGDGAAEEQTDTYFRVPRGRLKVRRRLLRTAPGTVGPPMPAELIAYVRPDDAGARTSLYHRLRFPAESRLESVLDLALGTETRVEKVRTVYLHDNVRIHLDEVRGLGSFLELEAIVDGSCDEAAATAKVAALRERFGIRDADGIAGSYREMTGEAG